MNEGYQEAIEEIQEGNDESQQRADQSPQVTHQLPQVTHQLHTIYIFSILNPAPAPVEVKMEFLEKLIGNQLFFLSYIIIFFKVTHSRVQNISFSIASRGPWKR